jgi:hypothetical protein
MGRLAFLRHTAPLILSQPRFKFCLVDYSCPDACGDWLEATFRDAIRERRAVVERVPGQPRFNKCRAHNAGARRARSEGAEYLCFLDADTLIRPEFSEHVIARMRKDRFLIAALRPDGSDMPSMTGLLVVHGDEFAKVGGFDEKFLGWGGEDIELRLRLYLLGGLSYGDVPLTLARPMEHDDSLRTRFYAQDDIHDSNRRNMMRVYRKIETEWKPRLRKPLESAARLWYHGGSNGGGQRLPKSSHSLGRDATNQNASLGELRPSGQGLQGLVRRVVLSRLSGGRLRRSL